MECETRFPFVYAQKAVFHMLFEKDIAGLSDCDSTPKCNTYTACSLPKKPEFTGSNPAEAVGFFGHPKNPQYAFLRRGSKIICPMSQLCGM
jgi:hypothetical protein